MRSTFQSMKSRFLSQSNPENSRSDRKKLKIIHPHMKEGGECDKNGKVSGIESSKHNSKDSTRLTKKKTKGFPWSRGRRTDSTDRIDDFDGASSQSPKKKMKREQKQSKKKTKGAKSTRGSDQKEGTAKEESKSRINRIGGILRRSMYGLRFSGISEPGDGCECGESQNEQPPRPASLHANKRDDTGHVSLFSYVRKSMRRRSKPYEGSFSNVCVEARRVSEDNDVLSNSGSVELYSSADISTSSTPSKKEPTEQNGASSMSLGSDTIAPVGNTDFDMESIPTTFTRLDNKAAYDKIAVRPKDRKAARKARGVSQIVHVDTHVNGFGDLSPTSEKRDSDDGSRESSPKAKRSRPPSEEPVDVAVQPSSDRATSIQKRLSMGRSPLGPGPGMPVSLAALQGVQGKLRKVASQGEAKNDAADGGRSGRITRAMTDSMAMRKDPKQDSAMFVAKVKTSTQKEAKSDSKNSAKNKYLSRKFGLSKPTKPAASEQPHDTPDRAGVPSKTKMHTGDPLPLRKFVESSSKSVTSPSSHQENKGIPLSLAVDKMDTDSQNVPAKASDKRTPKTTPLTSPLSPVASKIIINEPASAKKVESKAVLLSEFRKSPTPVASPTSPLPDTKADPTAKKRESEMAPTTVRKFGKPKNAPLTSPTSVKTEDSDTSQKPDIAKGKPSKESKVSAAAKFFSGGGNNDRTRKKSLENHSENNSKGLEEDKTVLVEAETEKREKLDTKKNESDSNVAKNVQDKEAVLGSRERTLSSNDASEKLGEKSPNDAVDEEAGLTNKADTDDAEAKNETSETGSKVIPSKSRQLPKLRSPSSAVASSKSTERMRKASDTKDKKPESKSRKSKENAPIPTYRLLEPQAPEKENEGKEPQEVDPGAPKEPAQEIKASTHKEATELVSDRGKRTISDSTETKITSPGVRARAHTDTGPHKNQSDSKTKESAEDPVSKKTDMQNERIPSRVPAPAQKSDSQTGPIYSRAKLKPIARETTAGATFEGRRNMSLKINTSSPSRTQRTRSFNVSGSPSMTSRGDADKLEATDKDRRKTSPTAPQGGAATEDKTVKTESAKTLPKTQSTPKSDDGMIQDVENNNIKPFPAVTQIHITPKDTTREVTPTSQPRRNSRTTPTDTKTARAKEDPKDGGTPAWVQLARRRSRVWEDSGMKSLRAATPRTTGSVDGSKTNDRPTSLAVSPAQSTNSTTKSRENIPKAASDSPQKPAQAKNTPPSPTKRASPLTPSSKVSLNRKPPALETNITSARRFTPRTTKDPSSAQPAWLAIAMQKQKKWTKEEAV